MTLSKITLNTSHLCLWGDDEKGLIYHQSLNKLFAIDPLSIMLLLLLDDGSSVTDAIVGIEEYQHLKGECITQRVESIIELLQPLDNPLTYADGRYAELKHHQRQPLAGSDFVVQTATSSFAITCCNAQLLTTITNLLSPIARRDAVSDNHVDFKLSVLEYDRHTFQIRSNGIITESRLTRRQVLPSLIDRMQVLTYQHSDYCFGFHGAALTRTQPGTTHRLLLPGPSGAGKSTLTTELTHRGFQLYSDEIIALNRQMTSLCIKLPIAIKSGSWQLFNENFPELSEQAEWQRLDGRRLKYIWPSAFADQPIGQNGFQHETEANTLLVMPRFKKDAIPSWHRLSVIDTITLLTKGGYQLGVELNTDWVEVLIAFCQSVNTYQINYSNSEQAIRLLDEVLAHP